MHQKNLQQTRGNAGGKEITAKKHCIFMDKMQDLIFSPVICSEILTRHKIQKRNSHQQATHQSTAAGFYGIIKKSHI